ncbi:hypothetical protein HKH46_002687 [Enterococcus faecalis]|nr:hypothetical protein [Enterococcus faecalis]
MSNALQTALAIQTLLSEYNVENDSLNTFIQEASELPTSENLDRYNDLVEEYNNASGYDSKKDSAEELIAFYNAHSEELSAKQSEITTLQKVLEDAEQLYSLYNALASQLEDGDY